MAAWQILGLIVIAFGAGVLIFGIIDVIKTLPSLWNMTPAYEEDEK